MFLILVRQSVQALRSPALAPLLKGSYLPAVQQTLQTSNQPGKPTNNPSEFHKLTRNSRLAKVAAQEKHPYSPFQNTNNWGEYALARLDDLLNWGRKVTS